MRRLLLGLVALPLVVAGAGSGWIAAHSRDVARADDADLHVTPLPIPPEHNGFALLERAADSVVWTDDTGWIVPASRGEAEALAPAADLVTRNEAALELVDQALALPALQLDHPTGMDATIERILRWTRIGILLRLRPWVETESRNDSVALDGFVSAVRFGTRVAEADGGELALASHGLQLRSNALASLRAFADRTPIGRDEQRRASAALAALALRPDAWKRTLARDHEQFWADVQGEIARFGLRQPGLGDAIPGRDPATFVSALVGSYVFQPNRTQERFAELYRSLARGDAPACGAPPARGELVPMARPRTLTSLAILFLPNGGGEMLLAKAAPLLRTQLVQRCDAEAELAATRAHLALRAYFVDHGALPQSLDALVPDYLPAVPRDPFGGAPLRYSAERRLVWSIGDDLRDEGGRPDLGARATSEPSFALAFDAPLGEPESGPVEAARR